MPSEQLELEISELAAHIHAATCRWLTLVAELDRRQSFLAWGCRSCADWLSLRCGIAVGAAREQVRVARRLEELPETLQAFAEGRLSYSKVRAISRVADADNERDLLELALDATAAQLEQIVRAYRRCSAATLETANAVHDERFLQFSWTDNGSLEVRGCLPAEEGELLLKAIAAARDTARGVSAETSSEDEHRHTNADALVEVAEASLAGTESARSGGDRYQLVIHAEADSLAANGPTGGQLEGGGAICGEATRRIACDTSIVAMSERNGHVLGVGRKTRTIPPALRRALRSRDGCCRFPGCSQRRFVDAHHIHHWADGGNTDLDNLMLLCRRHHRMLHEGGYRVRRARDGALDFRRPNGQSIKPSRRRRRVEATDLPRANGRSGLAINARTPVARSHGERFSLDLTVSGLVERSERASARKHELSSAA